MKIKTSTANVCPDDIPLYRIRNRDYIGRLLTDHYKTIYKYVNYIIRDPDDSQDVTQLAIIKICEKIDMYDSSRPFINWAITVAKNVAIDYKRKNNRDYITITNIRNSFDTTLFMPVYCDQLFEFNNDKIYGKYRILYMLHDQYKLTSKEISEITGLSIGTILCNISKSKKDSKRS